MIAAEKWAEGQPPELYCEVLRRAIKEVESKYLEKNFRGPLSGGWIVENIAVNVGKFQACLRHPETAPDNVIVLLDHTPDHVNILTNLNKSYRTEKHNRQYRDFLKEVGEAAELHGQLQELGGEEMGEDGLGRYSFPFPLPKIEKSSTEILMERLPVNDLTDSFETEKSQVTAHQRDRDRQISLADSELDITADPKKLLEEWFRTFDSKKSSPISEPSTGGPYSQPKPHIEAWIAKNVNYEMLTNASTISHRIRSSEDETGNVTTILQTVTAQSQSNSDEKPSTTESKRHLDFVRRNTKDIIAAFEGKSNIPSFLELGGEDNLRTPSGLLSQPDITCPEDGLLGPEDPPLPLCIPKLHEESPKRKFLKLVSIFDEFWDTVQTVMTEQQIRFFDMGVVDEDTVKARFDVIWDELELRWALPPTPVQESELREEIEEWEESNRLWGIDTGKMGDDELIGEFEEEIEEEPEEESDDDESEFETENAIRDPFEKLKNKPEQYLKAVSAVDEVRLYGDLKDYCPVTLLEFGVLRRGYTEFAAKYHDRIYLMANEDYLNVFLEDPARFIPVDKPFDVPAPRICITGPPGGSQEEVGIKLAEEHQIFYVNFRQRLQELIRVKVGKKVGPEAFDFDMKEGSLLGLEESNSSFVVPSMAVLGTGTLARTSKASIHEDEYFGEMGGEDYGIDWQRQRELDMLPVRKLGGSQTVGLATCPINTLARTEKIADRDWTKTNKIEKAITDFLELGAQLPSFVLDEYIAPLWQEQPFKCRGFILVGFPNTYEDMEYLTDRNFIPEFVYVVDCKFKAMRNRLLTKTVDDWHRKHAKPEKKQKQTKPTETGDSVGVPPEFLAEQRRTMPDIGAKLGQADGNTWGYKDAIAHRIASMLQQYHNLYTRNLKSLKMSMNRNRIRWTSVHADISLKMAEVTLYDNISTSLKFRTSMFESTYVLSPQEASVLIDRGFYRLSKFGRWCPVEIFKGNVAVNLWNAPGVTKIPVLYRGYIYFIAGERNLKQFQVNVWDICQQNCPTETMPLYVCVIGPQGSGKTTLAARLADQLGLVHIKQDEMIDDVLKHSFVNSMVYNYGMKSDSLNAGPQTMRMADEILTYLRRGHKLPQYMQFRALDLSLMIPKAQFHGVVFDDYPVEDNQLQELLERGIITTVVVNLEMGNAEAYRRAELNRFDPYYNYEDFTVECDNFIDYLIEDYNPMINPCLYWFENEIRCLLNIDASLSPTTIYKAAEARCLYAMNNMQRYIHCGLVGQPAVLEGTGPLTSHLEGRLSYLFRNYDPVALNETNELIKVDNVKRLDLKRVVEYNNDIYVFAKEKNVEMFLANPQKYTYPGCTRVPPKTVPMEYYLNEEQMANAEDAWGFEDFDPVYYQEGNFQYKWLKRGQPKYCVKYQNRFYFFLSYDNLDKFMRKPQDYWNHPLPSRLPAKANPKPLDNLSPSGYLIASGLSQDICHLLTVMATKRPRFPFMSLAKSGVLFMGYFLKSLNMKSTSELRTHYRKAMTHMLNTQSNAEKVANELEQLHGKRTIPHEVKKRMQNFLNLALKPDNLNIVDPFIPNLPFSFDSVEDTGLKMLKDIMEDIKREKEEERLQEMEYDEEENGEEEDGEDESEFQGEETSANEENEKYVGPAYLIKDVFAQEVDVGSDF